MLPTNSQNSRNRENRKNNQNFIVEEDRDEIEDLRQVAAIFEDVAQEDISLTYSSSKKLQITYNDEAEFELVPFRLCGSTENFSWQ